MLIGVLKVKLYASWVHSLKEKRMIVKSICAKLHNKFNVSASEVEEQDVHQTIVIGIAFVSNSAALADSVMDTVLNYLEQSTDAEILEIQRQIL